jgi:hypothetical protein
MRRHGNETRDEYEDTISEDKEDFSSTRLRREAMGMRKSTDAERDRNEDDFRHRAEQLSV